MFIELHRIIKKSDKDYRVEPIMVNVSNILFIEDDHVAEKSIKEGKFVGLDSYKDTEFCTVTFKTGSEVNSMLTVGSKYHIASRVREAKFDNKGTIFQGKRLLNG